MSETTNYLNYVPYEMLISETNKDKVYRDTNILGNILELVGNMHQTILDTTGDYRGFWFIVLYPVLMILGVVPRSLFYLIRELGKPEFDYEEHFVINNNSNSTGSFNVEMREKSNTLKDVYTSDKEEKVTKADAINLLRKEIYTNNMKLAGRFISDDVVTFGNELNEALELVFPNLVKLKTAFLTEGSLIEIKDRNSLQKEVSKLLHEDVNIFLS